MTARIKPFILGSLVKGSTTELGNCDAHAEQKILVMNEMKRYKFGSKSKVLVINTFAIHRKPMFVERKVRYSALFTNMVKWHAGAVSFPLSDVILAQLACPLSDIMLCLHSEITNLSLYKHCRKLHLRLKQRLV